MVISVRRLIWSRFGPVMSTADNPSAIFTRKTVNFSVVVWWTNDDRLNNLLQGDAR